MDKTGHGGDIYAYHEQYGAWPLDFSANVSPCGLPEGVKAALAAAAAPCEAYPDPFCRKLTEAIAKREGVPPGYVLCGGGAADLIWRAAYGFRPRRALVTAPAFSEYEAALAAAGCAVSRFALKPEDDFRVTEDFLDAAERADMVFVCNPNNPTGQVTPKELLRALARRCGERDAILVVDECFIDFLDAPGEYAMPGELAAFPHMILLRAFTKIFAMPGLRLGYCLSANPQNLRTVFAAGPPWSVSAPAQLCGLAALGDTEYPLRARALVAEQRARLKAALEDHGFKIYGSLANFIFFDAPDLPFLDELLREQGILIRSCDDYKGLRKGYFRAAVRDADSNQRLIAALARLKGGGQDG